MNTNQKFPGTGSPFPALVIIGLGFALIKSLFSGDDTEEMSENTDAEAPRRRKEAETPAFRHIPAEIPVRPAVKIDSPAPAVPERKPSLFNSPGNSGIPLNSAPAKIKVSPPLIIPAAKTTPEIPFPARKVITREDMAKVFNGGASRLTRTAAVSALKVLGFGKTAAYAALSQDGRFSAWLKCAPDGIMTWKD